MFYELKKVNDELNCSKCNERLDEPRILPCGDTVCSQCVTLIQINNERFDCILCVKSHKIAEEGLPINKKLLALLSMQPTEVSRSQAAESLKKALIDIEKNVTSLKYGANNGLDKIKGYCMDLRNDIQLATEDAIRQINEHGDAFIKEIDQFEMDCNYAYHSNDETRENVNKTVKELELFLTQWTEYLNQPKLNDEHILKATNEAVNLNEKAQKDEVDLDCLTFRKGHLKFTKNTNKLESKLIGSSEKDFTGINSLESSILSSQQFVQLLQLCEFSLEKRCTLLYRGSRDGFGAVDFHLKCDNQPNTFVIIKSTSGNVFGGYTQQNWLQTNAADSSKTDPNAFIFSFINKENTPLLMKCQDPSTAVYCHNEYGPLFGTGNSIRIFNNSNLSDINWSDLGRTYRHPVYAHGSDKAKSFLAGSYNFQTAEIEIYTIN